MISQRQARDLQILERLRSHQNAGDVWDSAAAAATYRVDSEEREAFKLLLALLEPTT